MRATLLLPQVVILTKACMTVVSMMTEGHIVIRVLPLGCLLFLLPNCMHVYAIIMQ